MFCTNCGKQVSDGSAFCAHCGAKIDAPNPTETATAADPIPESKPVSPRISLPTQQFIPPQQPNPRKPWYKKWWIWVLMGVGTLVLFSIIGNSSSSKRSSYSVKPEIIKATQAETAAATEKLVETQPPTAAPTEKPTDPPTEAPTEAPPEEENLVLYDANGITITYKGIESGWMGTEVKLLIENNTNTDYCIQTRNMSVNGYMMDPVFSPDVAAGKKANDSITFYKTQLEENDIDRIDQMEFNFYIFSWDDMLDSGFDTETIILNIGY